MDIVREEYGSQDPWRGVFVRAPKKIKVRLDQRLWEAFIELVEIARGDTRNLEGGFGLFTLWWSSLLLPLGPHAFDAQPWEVFRAFTPAVYVGPVGVLIGLSRFVGLGFRLWWLRATASFCGFLFWLSIAACSYLYDPAGTGWKAYGFYCALNAFLVIRVVVRRHRGST